MGKENCRSLGYPGRPIRGFESEQRVRFSVKKIACGLVAATDLYGPSGFARDDKVRVCASIQCGADGWVDRKSSGNLISYTPTRPNLFNKIQRRKTASSRNLDSSDSQPSLRD